MKNHYHIVACIPIATLMQNPCDIVSNHYDIGEKPLRHCWKPLQHLYKTIATFVQNHCDICAKPLQHLCKTIATFVQNHCNICAKPSQHLCKTITTFVQNQCKPIGQHWRIDAKYCKIIFLQFNGPDKFWYYSWVDVVKFAELLPNHRKNHF